MNKRLCIRALTGWKSTVFQKRIARIIKTEKERIIEKKGELMRRHLQTILFLFVIALSMTLAANAQVASGSGYTLEQSVIAGGGGTSADAGNQFSVTGSIGQPNAGNGANGSPYSLHSGFFTVAAPLAPTAATVSIGGRVLTADGRGIRNVILILTGSSGSLRTTATTTFGYYRFTDVSVGETYIITAKGKRFTFDQPTRVLNIDDDTEDINFIGNPASNLRDFQ